MSNSVPQLPKPIGQAFGKLITNLFDEITTDMGADIASSYRNWKAKNVSETLRSAAILADEEPLLLRPEDEIPRGFVFAFIEGAETAEFDEVRTLWARLLISAAKGNFSKDYKPYTNALEAFTPQMALVFAALCAQRVLGGHPMIDFAQDSRDASKALKSLQDTEIISALAALKQSGIVWNIERPLDFKSYPRGRISSRSGSDLDILSSVVSDAIQKLSMDNEIKFERAITRRALDGEEFVILSARLTEFGASLGSALGLSPS